jgi:hypothetical protein
MTPATYVVFAEPVTLRLSLPTASRPRVIGESSAVPTERIFERLPLYVSLDSQTRQISAHLPPIPEAMLLYGPDDFAAACADTMDDHAARVLHRCGYDPAPVLQALIDGHPSPEPPPRRVPREIANWRAKAVLSTMGKLADVDALIAAMPESDAAVMRLAWHGNAALARNSQTVATLGSALGFSSADLDAFFIAADAINL